MSTGEQPITITTDALVHMLGPLLQAAVQGARAADGDAAGAEASTSADDVDALLEGLKQHLALHIQSSQGLQGADMSLPEVDEQLLPLHQQVEAVLQSVASHRASVPAVISKALQQQLQHMRPAADDAAAAADQQAVAGAAAGAAVADTAPDTAQARQLHEALQAALNKLPSLRARLEEMDARLQRNLAAVDAAHGAASHTPRTVERVLRHVAAGQAGGAAAGVAGADDVDDGAADEDATGGL